MRLPVERHRSPRIAGVATGLTLVAVIAACSHAGAEAPLSRALSVERSGPAADYPMLLGQPFTVEGVTYTPADTMNYDLVGYASTAADERAGVWLAHRTLPLPSYVEVTSLQTGKTILVRVERRGPMSGKELVELSPGAAAQLGVTGQHTPVRVRRVNPIEPERALLRTGLRAPERMNTPMSLVGVLMRKLEPNGPALASALSHAIAPAPASAPVKTGTPGSPAKLAVKTAPKVPASAKLAPEAATKPDVVKKVATRSIPVAVSRQAPAAAPKLAPATPAAHGNGSFVIQVAAFADQARADAAARKLGGAVSATGKLHRVRINGFASAADAGAALAKARAAGYSDARIQRAD